MKEEAENSLKEIKESTSNMIDEMKNEISKLYDDYDKKLKDKKALEEKVKNNEYNTRWIKDFISKVEKLLETSSEACLLFVDK